MKRLILILLFLFSICAFTFEIEKEDLLSTPQNFTASWVDVGNPILMLSKETLSVFVDIDINNSINPRLRAVGQLTKNGNDYLFPILTVSTNNISVDSQYFEFPDTDRKYVLEIKTTGLVPFVQLQMSTETVGSTAGQIESLSITKVIR